jgi:hypothetical protein
MRYLIAILIVTAVWPIGTVLACLCVVHFYPPHERLSMVLAIPGDCRNMITRANAGIAVAPCYLRTIRRSGALDAYDGDAIVLPFAGIPHPMEEAIAKFLSAFFFFGSSGFACRQHSYTESVAED